MQRTYSRRGRRTVSKSADSSPEGSPEPPQASQQRKKRKIQVEVISQAAPASSTSLKGSRNHTKPDSVRQTVATSSNASQFKATGPLRRAASERNPLDKSGDPSAESPTTKDPLSTLFSSSEPPRRPSLSPQKSGGIVKRMLRRTRTESSIMGSDPSAHVEDAPEETVSISRTSRMFGLARADSIIDLTLDSPSSSSPLKAVSQSQEDILSSSPGKPARPALASTSVRTYAGKSRSFLVTLPNPTLSLDQDPSQTTLDESQGDNLEVPRESYTDLRLRWGVDNSEDDPYVGLRSSEQNMNRIDGELPPGIMNDLKSISELRSKGESRRFLDEMGYLFEGLDLSNATAVRRGSALEIVTKLCDNDFARRAKAADFLGKAWDILRSAGAGDGDKARMVLDSTLAFFAALAARDPVDLTELSSKPEFVDKLFDMLNKLDRSTDSLWLMSCGMTDPMLKRAGISRTEKALMTELHKMVRKKGGLFLNSEIISNRLLLSYTLALLPRSSLVPSNHLPIIVLSLGSELAPLPDRVSAFTSGLALIPELDSSTHMEVVSLNHIDNCLRLADCCLLARGADGEEDINILQLKKDLPGTLISLCVAADTLSRVDEYVEYKSNGTWPCICCLIDPNITLAHKCLESALRVLINLTHDNRDWCDRILSDKLTLPAILRFIVISQRERPSLVQSGPQDGQIAQHAEEAQQERAAALLDQLCLALGLLTNLVQVTEEIKDLISHIALDPSCPGTQECVFTCRCASTQPALSCLAHVYSQQCASNNDLDSVVQGHMAILIGLLIQRRPYNQAVLLDALPGRSNREKLHGLVENARDFTNFYVNFTNKVAESQQEDLDCGNADEAEDGRDTVDLRGSVGQVLRDTKGETVARDVITFLEGLELSTYD
ncbi:uncharacterized protein PHACADRAFT_172620 [Phanerochaete carnosa HHB-10118-sp]|uniref:Wings apart-like protein C-terminal domain-containing protein n=1 Tax=Phanerochaete carnosa (strain HHB-10118-sp) TaxID=650164 RepID=K5X2B9_PHACS|nr:uncharacterized protein PHACADRAFT_172620 [Phanerochaete carnosa HHB-10118-sp]EKM56922.1 hypothetical protein PHACADRAFT_172620 [Phanerochaete carnosa HHB-10118-sp]